MVFEGEIFNYLKLFAPGTPMRIALDDLRRARMGALIVLEADGIFSVIEGGFKVNCKFSAQRLVELAKMDGAIILSEDLKKILYANTLLVPKILKTNETGTRHKAAERTSKQFNTLVIAVSERKNKVTLYHGKQKHVLENSSEILRRATETLQILEKQKEILDDLLLNLNILEITNLVAPRDVCNVLQRMEMVRRVSEEMKKYLIELGKEGIIVSMRLKELTKGLNSEREFILRDYFEDNSEKFREFIDNMNFDLLLETQELLNSLFGDSLSKSISARGHRILNKINLSSEEVNVLFSGFRTLDVLFDADEEGLKKVLNKEDVVFGLKKDLDNLKEKILEGKLV